MSQISCLGDTVRKDTGTVGLSTVTVSTKGL